MEGNFVSANEINNAFNQIQNEYRTYVNSAVNQTDATKDPEQDARLAAGEQKNKEQDGRLGLAEQQNIERGSRIQQNADRLTTTEARNIEQARQIGQHSGRLDAAERKNTEQDKKLDGHDTDIGGIKANATFYDKDKDGKKAGGLTLNDGTGKQVQLRNVAPGTTETDAVNAAQLASTVAALGGGAKLNSDGSVQAPTYEIAGLQHNNVGDALKATYETSVRYVTDAQGNRTNNIMLAGNGTGPVAIRNLADGKKDSDAVNLRQVKQATQEAKSYTDERVFDLQSRNNTQFSALNHQIERNLQESRGGIASAMGMAALRFDNNPGKLSFASGLGNFKGSTSAVAGLGYTSEDGMVRLNASMGYNFGQDDLSWNAGASFTLN
ncbi:BrpC (plasmid) [Agrobacterium tumefaciens]|nr:BrpC [Agrobacterium tumefaciens]